MSAALQKVSTLRFTLSNCRYERWDVASARDRCREVLEISRASWLRLGCVVLPPDAAFCNLGVRNLLIVSGFRAAGSDS